MREIGYIGQAKNEGERREGGLMETKVRGGLFLVQ
jgi:hypothetical protein